MKKFTQQLTLYFVLFLGAQFTTAQTTIAENTSFSGTNGDIRQIGQSFTPTTNAELSSFNFSFTGTINSGTYNLYEGEGTSGTLLDSGNVVTGTGTGSTPKTLVTFSSNINVSSGSVYTLVWDISSPDFNFYFSTSNPYAGGFYYSYDAMFGVYSALSSMDLAFNLKGVTNTAPTFTSTPITSIDENQTYTYTITTTDTDNDAVTLTAPTLPSWLSLTTNVTVSTLAGDGTATFADGTGTAAQFKDPKGVAVDASGTVYVADSGNNRIRKITPAGVVTTFAGSGIPGFTNGSGSGLFPEAKFNSPRGLAVDGAGIVYVADLNNNSIRKITPSGISSTVVTTLAGGIAGFADGTGSAAKFSQPKGVAVDASGTVYVADYGNHRIRKITTAKVVTTLAGTGTFGFADGTGSVAQFNSPAGIAVDGSGNVYVADKANHCIRKITPAGVVSTFAGSTTPGSADGTGTAAHFFYPIDLVVDALGTVYVADSGNDRIRKITSAGVVTTLAGSTPGFVDGTGSVAKFNFLHSVAVDGSGTVYVADYINQRIRKITVSTDLSGDTTGGQAGNHSVVLNANDGNGGSTNQSFTITVNDVTAPGISSTIPADNATGVLISSNFVITFSENVQKGTGNILIKDAADNSTVQTIDVTTSAVTITNTQATINPPTDLSKSKNYYIQIPATAFTDASLNAYAGITDMTTWSFATELNNSPTFTSSPITSIDENQTYTYTITTADTDNDAVTLTAPTLPSWLSLTTNVTVSTFAGDGTFNFADGTGIAAQFYGPGGVAVDVLGTVYVADIANNRIRKITSAGVVSTLAGSSGTGAYLDGTGTAAKFWNPTSVAVDGSGTVYVADYNNHRIRKITSAGVVSTLAGGTRGFADGTGTAAQFFNPQGVAVDGSGNVYVADTKNHSIRKITSAGVVSTLAGSSGAGAYLDGTGTAAKFNNPAGIAVDGSGNVYVADASNNRIRKITSLGVVSTLAGNGTGAYLDGTGTAAQFYNPQGVAVDGSGNVYVADANNERIRKITSLGVVSTLAGSSGAGAFADGTGTAAKFNYPSGVAVDGSGTVYVADQMNSRIRKITVGSIQLTGDTTGKVGTHDVVLNANDGNGGSTDQSFTITVNDITAPGIASTVPADNATGISSSNLQIDFNENVQKGTGDISIKRVSNDQVVATIPVSGSEVVISNGTVTITISPTITLPSNTDLYVVIPNTAFTDMSGNSFAGLTTNTLWNFSTSTVLGIEDNIIKGFTLYPNPVKGVLNIRAQETLKTIQVFNLMGQQVFSKHLNSNKTTINLNRLPQGSYFVKIITDKTIKSVKLIKR